jgi:hypothetical protein
MFLTKPVIDWNLNEIKRKIAIFTNEGKLSHELVDTIFKNGLCAPIEFDLLDYKQDIESSKPDLAKLILRIISFYNTYGGYLVFGVAETIAEEKFEVVGFDRSKLNIESIKSSIRDYANVRIQINIASFDVGTIDANQANITFIHIPQRLESEPPVHFVKDSPQTERSKFIFQKDEVYYRNGDETLQAKGPYVLKLNGSRVNPFLNPNSDGSEANNLFRLNRIQHNLPDRNFICANFIGRELILDSLWLWLADDLSHIRVIAGEGGLGKSSIAYEFAERVSETPNVPFEQIVWLTAKEKQFRGYEDKYENVPEKHYSTYLELLNAICLKLAFTEEELNDATEVELKRMVKKGLSTLPSMIIVDDVDSLSVDEQKQVLELGLFTGGTKSRILLTTRNNQSYSVDTVIKISGFTIGDEFNGYIQSLQDRLGFATLKSSEISKIHEVTTGSPLFTESLIRLLRWQSLNDAVSSWKNERGVTVRAAALKREIEHLSTEAKRILLVIAMIVEASVVELSEVLGYPTETVETGLQELTSLFLIAAPALASVPRFRVPENTRRLVLDVNTHLVTDRERIEKDITTFRHRNQKKPTSSHQVAAAISQAASFLQANNISQAIATIKAARKSTKDHYDLLSFEASLLLKTTPPQIDVSRTLARKAYSGGCRRQELFECWFQSEWLAKNYVGALEAADAAISNKASGNKDWLIKKSAALTHKANELYKLGSFDGATSTMFEASKSLKYAILKGNSKDESNEYRTQQFKIHDQIWPWASESGFSKAKIQLEMLDKMKELGDTRLTNNKRVLSTMAALATFIERKQDGFSIPQKNLYATLASKANLLLSSNRKQDDNDIMNEWDEIQTRISNVIYS